MEPGPGPSATKAGLTPSEVSAVERVLRKKGSESTGPLSWNRRDSGRRAAAGELANPPPSPVRWLFVSVRAGDWSPCGRALAAVALLDLAERCLALGNARGSSLSAFVPPAKSIRFPLADGVLMPRASGPLAGKLWLAPGAVAGLAFRLRSWLPILSSLTLGAVAAVVAPKILAPLGPAGAAGRRVEFRLVVVGLTATASPSAIGGPVGKSSA